MNMTAEKARGFDELWPGGPRFLQAEESFKLSTDSVLLADFAHVGKGAHCLDLGCGAGVLLILLAAKAPEAALTGIEIQPAFAALSRENLTENVALSRAKIINDDLRYLRELVPAESFDLVVSNPPYFAAGTGYSAPNAPRAAAREEQSCTLSDLCAAAKWALRWGGSFAVVHRPERLSELFCAMTEVGIEPKRLREVVSSPGKAPSLVLVEGRRGGGKGLSIEAPLILTDSAGAETDEVQKIYRRGAYAPKEGTPR